MKKFFSFLIVAFVVMFGFNLNVYALVGDVSIKSAEVVNKTGKTDVIKEPNFKGLTIDLGVRFFDAGDSVTYKIVVENKGSSDVYINDVTGNTNSEYFDYAFGFENEDKTVKAKSSKTFNLIVSYKNNIPDEKFSVSGRVVEKNEVVIKLGNEVEVKNPNTASSKYVMILVVLILVIVAFILFMARYGNKLDHLKQTNIKLVILFVVIGLVLYLGYSYAIEAVSINVNSIVEVEKKIERKARLARSCMSDSYKADKSGFCIDWTDYVDYSKAMPMRQEDDYSSVAYDIDMDQDTKIKSIVLLTATSNIMEDNYVYNDISYKLSNTYDVSDIQNGEIILGVYTDNKEENYLLIIGQYSGVLAPIDASSLFSSAAANHSSNLFRLHTETNFTNLDVSDTTNMANMFSGVNYGALDLSMWNTSKIENISAMFSWSNFDSLNLNGFNTSKVTNMNSVFYGVSINQDKLDLSSFNTSRVTDMNSMFMHAQVATIDLSSFDTSNVTDMMNMFQLSTATEVKGLNKFNTSKVIYMTRMFSESSVVDLDLSSFNTSNVIDMFQMFINSKAKSINVSSFNTSKITDMSYMFYNSSATDLDLSSFDTSNVINMSYMFWQSKAKKIDVSSFDTSKVSTFSNMFNKVDLDYLNINNFNFQSTTSLTSLFANSKIKRLDISSLNTSNIKSMETMFSGSKIENLDLSNFDTSNVTSMSSMFSNSDIKNLDISNFNTTKLINASYMFYGVTMDTLDLTSFDTTNLRKYSYMFADANIKKLDFSTIYVNYDDKKNTYDFSSMFQNYGNKVTNPEIYLNNLSKPYSYYITSIFSNFNSDLKIYTNSSAKSWLQSLSTIPDANFVIV